MSPSDAKSKFAVDIVIEVATGVGGGGGLVGVVPPSPHAVSSKTATRLWSLKFKVFWVSRTTCRTRCSAVLLFRYLGR